MSIYAIRQGLNENSLPPSLNLQNSFRFIFNTYLIDILYLNPSSPPLRLSITTQAPLIPLQVLNNSIAPIVLPFHILASLKHLKQITMSLQTPATDATAPLFSPELISPEVLKALPEGYTCRPIQRQDYHNGFLDVLRVLTTVGDVSEEVNNPCSGFNPYSYLSVNSNIQLT